MKFQAAVKVAGWSREELRLRMERQWQFNACAKPIHKAAWFIGQEPHSGAFGLGVKSGERINVPSRRLEG